MELDGALWPWPGVVDYDPAWPRRFAAEAARLLRALAGEVLAVHHIGSTSVPGLRAKPIIDILLVVRDVERLDRPEVVQRMAALGYEAKGEFGIPGRRYFRKSPRRRTHHVHAFQFDNRHEIERHVALRDYLIAHPEAARRYAELKADLSARFPGDAEAYMDGKDALVKELEAAALAWWRGMRPPGYGGASGDPAAGIGPAQSPVG